MQFLNVAVFDQIHEQCSMGLFQLVTMFVVKHTTIMLVVAAFIKDYFSSSCCTKLVKSTMYFFFFQEIFVPLF